MLRALRMVVIAAATLLVSQACVVEDSGEVIVVEGRNRGGDITIDDLEDLYVDWTIDGSDSPALCDTFGVDLWVVDIRGPEDITIDVDCVRSDWSTGNELVADLGLLFGTYSVSVSAIDEIEDLEVTQASANIIIDDRDGTFENALSFDFAGSEF
jgi:hypothetical protein